jgi:hypothetical protein
MMLSIQLAAVLTLFFVGDSITTPVVGGVGVSSDLGYASIIDSDTDKRARWFGCPGSSSILIDGSRDCSFFTPPIPYSLQYQMNGVPSYFQLEVMPYLSEVDVVGVMFGINDSLAYRISPEDYSQSLLDLAERAVGAGAGVVMLIGAYHAETSVRDPLSDLLLAAYREAQEALAMGHEFIVLGPDLRDFVDDRHFTLPDGIHVNADGHVEMADALRDALPAPCYEENGIHLWGARGTSHCLYRQARSTRDAPGNFPRSNGRWQLRGMHQPPAFSRSGDKLKMNRNVRLP